LAYAAPVMFRFTGVNTDFFPFLPFDGSYTFDSEFPDNSGEFPNGGFFNGASFTGPPYGVTVHYQNLTFTWPGVEIFVGNDQVAGRSTSDPPRSDSYSVNGLNDRRVRLRLRIATRTVRISIG
jgi:hypothetical protein